MYKIVGALVAVSISLAGRIAAMQFFKPPVPPIQFAMPTGTPLPGGTAVPQFQPMVLPFPMTGQPGGFSFPSPSTILGSGPAPTPVRSTGRREAARSGARTPYSPAKSLRGTARPASGPAARPQESGRGAYASPGR
jgi:hypothetical protein